MNKYKWSAKHNAFFPKVMLSDYEATWDLTDIVDVSDEMYAEFSAQPPDGKMRGVVDEMPAWVDVPPPTYEEKIADAERMKLSLKANADSEIDWRQDAVDAGMATEDEITDLAEWKKYRVLLMRVDTSKPEWPEKPE